MHAYNRMCVCVYIRMCARIRLPSSVAYLCLSVYLRESERAREREIERENDRASEQEGERERASKSESEHVWMEACGMWLHALVELTVANHCQAFA